MNLKVRDVSRLLNVSEETVYKWLKDGEIPAYKIQDEFRFNRAEILEWANSRRLAVSPSAFEDAPKEAPGGSDECLSGALSLGGIHRGIGGSDRESVLRNVVSVLPLPEGTDRAFLAEMLVARENMGSTAVGSGIAIPHPRFPVILPPAPESLSLCFLDKPVDFCALDGRPVNILFVLISSTVNSHLRLLSRLAFALQDGKVTASLTSGADNASLLETFSSFDKKITGGRA